MATQPLAANTAAFTFRIDGLADADLRVTAFEGDEALGELFSFRVRLATPACSFDLADLLGRRAELTLHGGDGSRTIHGILWGFAHVGEGQDLAHFEAELVPPHRTLTRRVGSRVFEPTRCPDMTVGGIVERVLTDAGLGPHEFHIALQNPYPRPDFVAQYRESDWDFINRLLEHEGIHHFFEQRDDGCRMVISDDPASFREAAVPRLPFRRANGLVPDEDCVYEVRDRHQTQFGTVSLDDYTFRDPGQELRADLEGKRNTALHFSEYPADYKVKSEGQRYAALRKQAFDAERNTLEMLTTTPLLGTGTRFTLAEHVHNPLDGAYLVTKLRHAGTQPQSGEQEVAGAEAARYEATVTTMSADVRYRPPRRTARPTVAGSQTALVVGPESEEIHTDEYGRVRVQFHWDQDGTHGENSSAWIRVSQGLAGGGYGMFFLPRVGQEVIVDFLEGNPDCPIITGRVYNKDHMPPYALPQYKNRSTIKTRSTTGGGGSNELRFDDTKDAEQVLLYGHKDLHIRAGAERRESIGDDRHLDVGRDRFEQAGRDVHIRIGRDQRIEVGRDKGELVAGNSELVHQGTVSAKFSGDVAHHYASNRKATVTGTDALAADMIRLEATTTLELVCGGSSIVLTPGAIFIKGGPTVHINGAPGPTVASPPGDVYDTLRPTGPQPADEVEHGVDTRYGAGGAVQQAPVTPPAEAPPEEPGASWIEIELVDEDDQPVPGEEFELQLPDGTRRTGRLNANGVAHVAGIQPGTCLICFPNLDAECWERI